MCKLHGWIAMSIRLTCLSTISRWCPTRSRRFLDEFALCWTTTKTSGDPLRTFCTVYATSVKPDSNMVVNTNRGELMALSVNLCVPVLSPIPVLRRNAWIPVAPPTKRIQSSPSVGVLGAIRDESGFDRQNIGGGATGSKLFPCFLSFVYLAGAWLSRDFCSCILPWETRIGCRN